MLVKVKSQKQAQKLKKVASVQYGNGRIQVKVVDHPTLNVVKGVIRAYDIAHLKEEEIAERLKDQKVTEVQIIKRKDKDGQLVNSRMAILTFKSTKLPKKVDF